MPRQSGKQSSPPWGLPYGYNTTYVHLLRLIYTTGRPLLMPCSLCTTQFCVCCKGEGEEGFCSISVCVQRPKRKGRLTARGQLVLRCSASNAMKICDGGKLWTRFLHDPIFCYPGDAGRPRMDQRFNLVERKGILAAPEHKKSHILIILPMLNCAWCAAKCLLSNIWFICIECFINFLHFWHVYTKQSCPPDRLRSNCRRPFSGSRTASWGPWNVTFSLYYR